MNYQEWQHSDFSREERSCQSCHMPKASGPVRSRVGAWRRARHAVAPPVRRRERLHGADVQPLPHRAWHRGVVRGARGHGEGDDSPAAGGDRHADAVGAAAHAAGLSRSMSTCAISPGTSIRPATRRDAPGFTSPCVTRRDARYSSRALWTATGAIAGNDSDADPLTFEPHYEEITRADQVQIYEPILGDRVGAPTTGLLTATQYLKDNRLLPRGFDKATADKEIGVYGEAARDADFRRRRRPRPLQAGGAVGRAVHGGGGAALPADRLPLGTQSRTLRRARTEALRRLLQLHVGRVLGRRCHCARGRRRIVTALSHTSPLIKDRAHGGTSPADRALHHRVWSSSAWRSAWYHSWAAQRLPGQQPPRSSFWPRRRRSSPCVRGRPPMVRSSALPAHVPP